MSDGSKYTVFVQIWKDHDLHQIHVLNETPFIDGSRILTITGSPQSFRDTSYGYGLGQIAYFPNTMEGYSKRYYFASSFNNDVTMDDARTKLKETGDNIWIEILRNLWSTLFGRICITDDKGDSGLITSDFQIVKMNGDVFNTKLIAVLEEGKTEIASYSIPDCLNLSHKEFFYCVPGPISLMFPSILMLAFPTPASVDVFYGSRSLNPLPLYGKSHCAVNFATSNGDLNVGISQEHNKLQRFASLTRSLGSTEFVSTGFEPGLISEDYKFTGYYGSELSFPSDTVLGIKPGYRMRLANGYFVDQAIYANHIWRDCTWEYGMVAMIDAIYANLIGATVQNGEWIIQDGYVASNIKTGLKSRLRISMVGDQAITLIGFSGQSITVKIVKTDTVKVAVMSDYKFDSPSKWTKPSPPKETKLFEHQSYSEFTKQLKVDGTIKYTIQVEYWSKFNTHQIHILEQETPNTVKITGSSQTVRKGAYGYWFGYIAQFPSTMIKKYPKWYYFASAFNCDITIPADDAGNGGTSQGGTKIKENGNPALIRTLRGVWRSLIGKECEMVDTGIEAFVTSHFRLVTFDGNIHSTALIVQFQENSTVITGYRIESCHTLS
jgi:hypothetical protein